MFLFKMDVANVKYFEISLSLLKPSQFFTLHSLSWAYETFHCVINFVTQGRCGYWHCTISLHITLYTLP